MDLQLFILQLNSVCVRFLASPFRWTVRYLTLRVSPPVLLHPVLVLRSSVGFPVFILRQALCSILRCRGLALGGRAAVRRVPVASPRPPGVQFLCYAGRRPLFGPFFRAKGAGSVASNLICRPYPSPHPVSKDRVGRPWLGLFPPPCYVYQSHVT